MDCIVCGTPLQGETTLCSLCSAQASNNPYDANTSIIPYIHPDIEASPASEDLHSQQTLSVSRSSQETSLPGNVLQDDHSTQSSSHSNTPQQPPFKKLQASKGHRGLVPRLLTGKITLFAILALFLIGEGSGLAYYIMMVHPTELYVQATAVARAVSTGLALQNIRASATANATTPEDIYTKAIRGKPVLVALTTSRDSDTWQKFNQPTLFGSCAFSGGAYHVQAPAAQSSMFCISKGSNFRNFAFQVQMTIVKGASGGVIFRANDANFRMYLFGITQEGGYSFNLYTGTNFLFDSQILHAGFDAAIHRDLNQPNQVTIIAKDGMFYFYVNRQFIVQVSDNTYGSGEVGIMAASDKEPTDVAFSNAQIWML